MKLSIIALVICTAMLTLFGACNSADVQTARVDDISFEQAFTFEAPEGTVNATLTITGKSSGPFKLFVSDGLFTSTFDIPAGDLDMERSFEWYESPLLVNYVPDPAAVPTGNIGLACSFATTD